MRYLNLRNNAFWLIDKLKGGSIKKHYKEITSILNKPTTKSSIKLRENNLYKVLKHAIDTTSFYKKYNDFNSILDFPVIKKTVVQDTFEAFQSKLYKNSDNFKVSTSGSTGVPFFLFQDVQKRNRNRADVIYFLDKCGYNIGNKLYELEVWRKLNKKRKLKSWLQNVIQFDTTKLTDERIEEFLHILKTDRSKNKTILGFASSFEMIAQYLEKKDVIVNVEGLKSAIANSEYLNPYTKKVMGQYLNTQVLSRYSSEEIGIVAHQTLDSPNNFVINHASYYVEILNFDNDNPVETGEYGRIVVTDLFNYAMPMIRYDTGDIAKLNVLENGTSFFEKVEGRKMDLIYDTNGNIVSSFVVYTKFYKYYKLLQQYQFIQKSKKVYEIKLNLKSESFEFENELIEDVKNDFGHDAIVNITYVDEIPPLSSGKRRKVVSLLNS